jgi:ubiquinol-cytochrome c reductase cytochrome b subunit/menaquinol-cytochrome c reductase cytochrome b/c subunit
MACVVLAVIITLSLVLGAGQGPKANPTTTSYVPRPDWYFFFLFELLRVVKPSSLTQLATIGIPTIGMILLFLLPFYDRGPERRPERRPVAAVTFVVVFAAMALLTYKGAHAGDPTTIGTATPQKIVRAGGATLGEYEAGKAVVAQTGCLACHKIGENGNDGPGPNLTHVAARLPVLAIARTLVNPTAPMPSFKNLPPKKFNAAVAFLSQLK